jgi:anti-sigma factor RsiW
MNAHNFIEKAVLYSYGELGRQETAEFRLHLAACPDCRATLAAFSAVKAARVAIRPPKTALEAVRNAILGKERVFAPLFALLRPALLGASAVLLLIALNLPGTTAKQPLIAATDDFETQFSAVRERIAGVSAGLASGGAMIEDFDYRTSVVEQKSTEGKSL